MQILIDDLLTSLPNLDSAAKAKLNDALQLAIDLHSAQKARPDGPYTHHILRVAGRIAKYYEIKDVDIICAALLHDAVEDQAEQLHAIAGSGTTNARKSALQHILEKFGTRVAHIVESVTNPHELDEMEGDDKNDYYVAHVAEMINQRDVFYVKLADFADNGLNLEVLKDKEKRLALAKKYVPLYTVFLHRLRQPDIAIKDMVKAEIAGKLLDARLFAQMVIAAQ